MILWLIRIIFALVVLAIAFPFAVSDEVKQPVLDPKTGQPTGLSADTKTMLLILVPFLLAIVVMLADVAFPRKSLGGISGLFFGLVVGIVLAYILGMVVQLGASVLLPRPVQPAPAPAPVKVSIRLPDRELTAPPPAGATGLSPADATSRPSGGATGLSPADATTRPSAGATAVPPPIVVVSQPQPSQEPTVAEGSGLVTYLRLLIGAFAIYICVSFVLQTKDDFRFIIPYVEFARERRGARPILLDTSVIIDGRIADIADTQILESRIIVPRFVLEEIQGIADSSDKLKRNRGRRGLDMLNRLRSNEKINIELTDLRIQVVEQAGDVDQKLVALAQHLDGRVVTNDYNLNKICKLREVDVINVNDLANALKPVVLPGETLSVKIIKPGEEMGQGVGYLDDGTMVVAEHGRDHIGQELTLVVTSVLQTAAGRMIFGRPGDTPGPSRLRRS